MPATEQTWRDTKLLHAVFGVSCLAMLLATIWMLAADHRREWKDTQRTFREVEVWTASARIAQQQTDSYLRSLTAQRQALAAAQQQAPGEALVQQFQEAASEVPQLGDPAPLKVALDHWREAADTAGKTRARGQLVAAARAVVARAQFREEGLLTKRKARAADFDVARSQYESAIEHGLSADVLARRQAAVDAVTRDVESITLELQAAKTKRLELEQLLAEMVAPETKAAKDLEEFEAELKRRHTALGERQVTWYESLLEWPILDAFGTPTKIDQIWLPKLTLNNNFRDVARFDRCTTCHQAIAKTRPDTATEPGYPHEQRLEGVVLPTPNSEPPLPADPELGEVHNRRLLAAYGLGLAERGLLGDENVTINEIRVASPAALAGLLVGDVIERINDTKILDRGAAVAGLLADVAWGQPLRLTIRRGLPHPFASHPRLDLFVGSLSPHAMANIGCTICHEGQGSATQFKWASHTPNDPAQAQDWQRDHGWFNNHHWIFPMTPARFAESMCLKCHHDVVELEPSDRFPDPPAPKLLAGYDVIRQYGCFGCHEINGYDGPARRVGPDLRTEPNYSAAAQSLLARGALTAAERPWAAQLAAAPEDSALRRRLLDSLRNPQSLASLEAPAAAALRRLRAEPATARLVTLLEDVETPGQLRKVGPSLRHLASKVDFAFLYAWIRNPRDFRPDTKMPRFFGLHKHLEPGTRGLKDAQKFEPIEIRAITEYLLAKSQPFEPLTQPAAVTAQPSAERGKLLLRNRGCLACHSFRDEQDEAYPRSDAVQGPDLSNIGAKFNRPQNQQGPQWLYSWLRDPARYHARTFMPDTKLEPIAADGQVTDPAADIVEYLLSTGGDWKPEGVPGRQLSDDEKQALHDLALEHLKAVFPTAQAQEYLLSGIPAARAAALKGDEVELVVSGAPRPGQIEQLQLQFVGRRTLTKFGCTGCHDIPGLEDVKPIGTGLADWGRKTPDKLAFEQIVAYLSGHGSDPHARPTPPDPPHAAGDHAAGHAPPSFAEMDPDTGFYIQALFGHERAGFLWQKLREPRSYDYKKTENKPYNDRLRMPQFNLSAREREAVVTFVLGLVAEPPAPQYVYQPSPRRKAIVAGQKIIDKYNCGGCHALALDRWRLAFAPGELADPTDVVDFPFLSPQFTSQQVAHSARQRVDGKFEGTVTGQPSIDDQSLTTEVRDSEGVPIEPDDTQTPRFTTFILWEDVLLGGKAYQAGVHKLSIPDSAVVHRYEPRGGYLARLLLPHVVRDERQITPNQAANEGWAWLPPPLVGQGRKVQADWLRDFLLDPHLIRPAAVLRMPKFNLSPAEASALVDYFIAVDGGPDAVAGQGQAIESHFAQANASRPNRLQDAMKLVVSNDFCVKCHSVGDFVPDKSDRARAPQLATVYDRLRPEYMLRWLARPSRILPYTTMPMNFGVSEVKAQNLFQGTSQEQVEALSDLFLNYDRFARDHYSVKRLVPDPPPATAPAAGEAGGR